MLRHIKGEKLLQKHRRNGDIKLECCSLTVEPRYSSSARKVVKLVTLVKNIKFIFTLHKKDSRQGGRRRRSMAEHWA
jgi:hypothetical protein